MVRVFISMSGVDWVFYKKVKGLPKTYDKVPPLKTQAKRIHKEFNEIHMQL